MFTGIVEEVGILREIREFEGSRSFRIGAREILSDLEVGSSVSLDGACHTIVETLNGEFVVNSIGTTLAKTIASDYCQGDKINLERAVLMGSRLDGHLVQGHVDGTGEVIAVENRGQYHLVDIKVPLKVTPVTLIAGSITVNGVSLTINAIPIENDCQVAIIPFTWDNTNLQKSTVGLKVNIEGDLIGKYLQRLQKYDK